MLCSGAMWSYRGIQSSRRVALVHSAPYVGNVFKRAALAPLISSSNTASQRVYSSSTKEPVCSTSYKKSEYDSEEKRKRSEKREGNNWRWMGLLGGLTILGLSTSGYAEEEKKQEELVQQQSTEGEENVEKEESFFDSFISKVKSKWRELKFIVQNPLIAANPLLLPPIEEPHYTVVIDLNDLFVREVEEGRIALKKRPGIDFFLGHLSNMVELIIWCSDHNSQRDAELAMKLDRNRRAHAILFYRDCTMTNGILVKDLARLNRDLKNVFIISSNAPSYGFQPENAVHLKPWNGDESDSTFLDLAMFFEEVSTYPPENMDVRRVLAQYEHNGERIARTYRPFRLQYQEMVKDNVNTLHSAQQGGTLLSKLRTK